MLGFRMISKCPEDQTVSIEGVKRLGRMHLCGAVSNSDEALAQGHQCGSIVQQEFSENSNGVVVEGRYNPVTNVAEALAKRLPRQAQEFGGLELIGLSELQDRREENAINFD